MIDFVRFSLDNGLKVLVHEDKSTPLIAMNILYNVGSKDEEPDKTGLAHLFEHLMFGGSVNIPDYDTPLQLAGGENNAFTNNDITNYYLTLPANNIETGFWLESDRMLELALSSKGIEIQKNVVCEEFNQRYLNQPYGDAILNLRPLAYKVHPYRWPTIGIEPSHIRNITTEQAKDFFFSHYAPNNAILALAGNIKADKAYSLAEKWFGSIDRRNIRVRDLPSEPEQKEERILNLERDVPSDAIYKVWHTGPRKSEDFYTLDLLTDLLAGGESGRLYNKLVRGKKLFSEINAYLTADIEPGLIFVHGKLMKGADVEVANESINEVINSLLDSEIEPHEMNKVKNRFESSTIFTNTSILNKAANLALFECLGDASLLNTEVEAYMNVTSDMVKKAVSRYLIPSNCSTLNYISLQK